MTYEVMKVANGYLIRPGSSWQRNEVTMNQDINVFPTWTEASKWLRDQFEVKPE